MAHTPIGSREDFEKAVQTQGKYVLIYFYEGTVPPMAEEMAKKHSGTTDAYKVDVSALPQAKENAGVTSVPAVVIFKDGKLVKKIEGDPKNFQEIATIVGS